MAVFPTGARSALYIYEEGTFGTAPTSKDWKRIPFLSWPDGGRRPAIDDDLLGLGRGGADPGLGMETWRGTASVPIDDKSFGWWLRALFGAPATSGSGDYTHVFTAGGASIPSMSAIQAHADRDTAAYLEHVGIAANTLGLSFRSDSAWARAAIGLIGKQTNAPAGSYTLGTTTSEEGARFPNWTGCLSIASSEVGYVTALDLNYSNNIEAVDDAIACGEYSSTGFDLGMSRLSGSMTVRFANNDLWTAANAATELALAAAYEDTSTRELGFAATVRAFREGSPVSGPGAVTQRYSLVGVPNGSGVVLTATLKNAVSAYTYA